MSIRAYGNEQYSAENLNVLNHIAVFYENNTPTDYQQLSIEKGIPLVEGYGRDLKADFKLLAKTAGIGSKENIEQYLGKMVGDVPFVTKERMEWLNQEDPYDTPAFGERRKFRHETFEWHIIPSHIRRTADENTMIALEGDTLIEVNSDRLVERDLIIPMWSLENLRVLSSYPPNGGERPCVFDVDDSFGGVFEQREPLPHGAQIWFTRKERVGQWQDWSKQQQIVAFQGDQITSAFVEAWKNALLVLKTGTCPLIGTYARTSTMSPSDGPLSVGRFDPNDGLLIDTDDFPDGSVGVTPCALGNA
jgi:hypothetical protein